MKKYNHMMDIAFSVVSNTEDGSDINYLMLRQALLDRIDDLDAQQEQGDAAAWTEATGLCDTYEMGD